MDEDQQLRREIQAHWRELIISRIGRLNGQRVGELGVADLEWAERRWMEQIRRSWFEVDQDVHVHYYALECAIRGLHPELASPKPAASQEQRFPVLMPLEHGTSQAWPQPPPAPIAKPTDVREREHDSSAREDPRRQETIAKEEAVEQIIEEAERPEQLPSLADKDQELSSSEQSRLTVLERTVEEGLATFVEIGIALAEIRDRRLYRAAYRTFAHALGGRCYAGGAGLSLLIHPPLIRRPYSKCKGKIQPAESYNPGVTLYSASPRRTSLPRAASNDTISATMPQTFGIANYARKREKTNSEIRQSYNIEKRRFSRRFFLLVGRKIDSEKRLFFKRSKTPLSRMA